MLSKRKIYNVLKGRLSVDVNIDVDEVCAESHGQDSSTMEKESHQILINSFDGLTSWKWLTETNELLERLC